VRIAVALWKISRHRATLPVLTRALDDEDYFTRVAAIQGLGVMGADAKSAIPVLLATFTNERDPLYRPLLRACVARALGQMGAAAKPAVLELVRALEDSNHELRVAAAQALWQIEKNPAAIPVLIRGLRDSLTRDKATDALGSIGPAAKAAVPYLVYSLRIMDYSSSAEKAARALGQIGPAAKAAVPSLHEALHDFRPEVRRAAAEALRKIDPDATKIKEGP